MAAHVRVDVVDGVAIRTITTTSDDHPHPDVVLLPGLGIPDYLDRTARVLAGLGLSCTVLDLPGFGQRRHQHGVLSCPPDVVQVGTAAAGWLAAHCDPAVRRRADRAPVVLLGHSTAAQAALHASVRCGPGLLGTLVLAAPTVAPRQRSVRRLAAVTPGAYRLDSWTQAPLLGYVARYGPDLLRLTRTGIADRPEDTIARVEVPVLLVAGRHDAYTPTSWLATLARASVRAPWVRFVQLPGSHNAPYTFPRAFAGVLAAAVSGVRAGDRVQPGSLGR